MGESKTNAARVRTATGLGEDPLGTPAPDALLKERFYSAPKDKSSQDEKKKKKPTHYKVVSISLYTEDIERLEEMVAELKGRGHTKANKSQLIRFALSTVNLDDFPRGY